MRVLQSHLMNPELCEIFCEEYTRHLIKLRMEHNASIGANRAELSRLEAQRDRIIQAVKDGFANAELKTELDQNVTRREELARLLDDAKEAPTLIHPKMAERYRREVMRLVAALNDETHRTEAADLIRGLIDKIVLTPKENGNGLTIDLYGDLAGILAMAAKDQKALTQSSLEDLEQFKMVAGMRGQLDLSKGQTGKQDKMVAGARNRRYLHLNFAPL